jgi:hypothetical protein
VYYFEYFLSLKLKSIGLPNAQHEMGLVQLQTKLSEKIMNECFEEILITRNGQGLDNAKLALSENILKARQHAASHATSRNY